MTTRLPGQSEGRAVKGLAKSGTVCTMIEGSSMLMQALSPKRKAATPQWPT